LWIGFKGDSFVRDVHKKNLASWEKVDIPYYLQKLKSIKWKIASHQVNEGMVGRVVKYKRKNVPGTSHF